jgi:dolichyl-phosphate-mannose-protein mannosyltransferase
VSNSGFPDTTTELILVLCETDQTEIARPEPEKPKKRKHLNFFRKFFELQILMIQHNAGLTDSHPYASGPINWPFLLSGISFWTGQSPSREQIYFIGNFVDWWFCVLALSVFVGILGAEQLARRRGIQAIPESMYASPSVLLEKKLTKT